MASIQPTVEQIRSGSLKASTLVEKSLERIQATSHLNAFVSVFDEAARAKADEIDTKASRGEPLGNLAGIPIAIKDNIVFRQGKTTCSSRILAQFASPYDATVVARLLAQDAILVGKTNLDEFAMGSSTETSVHGPTLNPYNEERIPGGSSGGSAAAVGSGAVSLSLGSDTGGSVRQPAACCGVVGLKPTYGRVSRYGLVAFASSLDQIGPMGHTVADVAHLLQQIAGTDPLDQTSSDQPVPDFHVDSNQGVEGVRIGVPKEYFGEGLQQEIRERVETILAQLEGQGAKLVPISLPHMEYGIAAYYIIACAEASANLARFDGVRYTHRTQKAQNLQELYSMTRSEGFGEEVKRRIMLGTYVLSSGFYDAYYLRAQKVRRLLTDDFNAAFSSCDLIATPTMPQPPAMREKLLADPLSMYLQDVYTVAVNLAGLPGISIPIERGDSFSTGMQLIGKPFGEKELLQSAHCAHQLALPDAA